ncbi:MAG TPA: type I DNA topoisomerase [archaeon]|nr:type I DNA topoisomerase [archaeon]
MGKNLVIVESPAKARTLSKYLGKDFEVRASMGHVIDLPPKRLGVDLDHDFKPSYQVITGKGKIINELKHAAEGVEDVYLAPDPDREGEAIAWHLAGLLGKSENQIHRVLFNEITRNAVLEAVGHPTRINRNLFEAQQARRILDRLVGYQISPLLWKVVKGGLSAGRVQSVAVRIICERENEIQNYQKKEFWSITADLLTSRSESFSAKLWSIDDLKVVTQPDKEAERKDRYWIKDAPDAGRISGELRAESLYKVTGIERKERKRNPPPPFITSTMQREAAVRFGWPAKKTMQVAQTLYEGVDLGAEGAVGLITYMRTDSTRMAESAVSEVRKLVSQDFGEPFLPKRANVFSSSKGKVQDAHEAIRPTSVYHRPEKIRTFMSVDQYKLYFLIWSRFVACQMTPAVYDQTTVDIAAGARYMLRASGSVLRFAGFTAVYVENLEPNGSANGGKDSEDKLLPELKKGDQLILELITPRQHFTQPPPRYTESSLIRELEANGIGRPSTYAAIMSTILDKGYVQRIKGALKPTDLGFVVNELLVERFPNILNVKFTAKMENMLDEVEEGRQDWLKVLKDFYGDFKPALEAAQSQRGKVTVKTDINCEKCGARMVIRWSRAGEFLGCSAYPNCKNIKQFERDEEGNIRIVEDKLTDVKCEQCGRPMVKKSGRYGPFLACSGYPACNGIKPLSTGIKCPREDCKGELVQKKSRKGKIFYGCIRYPKCDFATWDRPLALACPNCGARPIYEKTTRTRYPYIYCSACRQKLTAEDLANQTGSPDSKKGPEETAQST